MMKRNYPLFFIFSTLFLSICLGFLMVGLFADGGLLSNIDTVRRIESTGKTYDVLNAELESLMKQESSLSSDSGLRDSAQKLGYVVDGESVILFEEASIQEDLISGSYDTKDFNRSEYEPLPRVSCFAIAFAISLAISSTVSIIGFIKEKSSDSSEERPIGGSGDCLVD